jgi:hypothetical protein
MARNTTIAKPMTNTAIANRAIFCQRTLLFYRFDVGDVELEVGLALELVALE